MHKNSNNFEQFLDNDCYTSASEFSCNTEFIIEQRKQCPFCPKLFEKFAQALIVNRALYLKYSSSQNYYYSREINKYVESTKQKDIKFRRSAIAFNDFVVYDDSSEYLNEFFPKYEINEKIALLTEYYKFHSEIPRIFQPSISLVLNSYHNRKRRIDYYKIKQLLNEDDAEHTSHSSIRHLKDLGKDINNQTKNFPTLLGKLSELYQGDRSSLLKISEDFKLFEQEVNKLNQEKLPTVNSYSKFYLNNEKLSFNHSRNNGQFSELKTILELDHYLGTHTQKSKENKQQEIEKSEEAFKMTKKKSEKLLILHEQLTKFQNKNLKPNNNNINENSQSHDTINFLNDQNLIQQQQEQQAIKLSARQQNSQIKQSHISFKKDFPTKFKFKMAQKSQPEFVDELHIANQFQQKRNRMLSQDEVQLQTYNNNNNKTNVIMAKQEFQQVFENYQRSQSNGIAKKKTITNNIQITSSRQSPPQQISKKRERNKSINIFPWQIKPIPKNSSTDTKFQNPQQVQTARQDRTLQTQTDNQRWFTVNNKKNNFVSTKEQQQIEKIKTLQTNFNLPQFINFNQPSPPKQFTQIQSKSNQNNQNNSSTRNRQKKNNSQETLSNLMQSYTNLQLNSPISNLKNKIIQNSYVRKLKLKQDQNNQKNSKIRYNQQGQAPPTCPDLGRIRSLEKTNSISNSQQQMMTFQNLNLNNHESPVMQFSELTQKTFSQLAFSKLQPNAPFKNDPSLIYSQTKTKKYLSKQRQIMNLLANYEHI